MTYYLAIDIGASSGRHILGHMEDGKLVMEEIYRFENFVTKKMDTYVGILITSLMKFLKD